jgi:hypothetical protein
MTIVRNITIEPAIFFISFADNLDDIRCVDKCSGGVV